ncbi:hypothetical protein MP228_012399 [Amoeboaphelidium protococcarum]|nr:hypothetical protein MP228_012399 [Amoeboaphelidium protococcarum]
MQLLDKNGRYLTLSSGKDIVVADVSRIDNGKVDSKIAQSQKFSLKQKPISSYGYQNVLLMRYPDNLYQIANRKGDKLFEQQFEEELYHYCLNDLYFVYQESKGRDICLYDLASHTEISAGIRGDQYVLAQKLLAVVNGDMINLYLLPSMVLVGQYQHSCQIKKIYCNDFATKIIIIDDSQNAYIYHSLQDISIKLPLPDNQQVIDCVFQSKVLSCCSLFLIQTEDQILVIAFTLNHVRGEFIDVVANITVDHQYKILDIQQTGILCFDNNKMCVLYFEQDSELNVQSLILLGQHSTLLQKQFSSAEWLTVIKIALEFMSIQLAFEVVQLLIQRKLLMVQFNSSYSIVQLQDALLVLQKCVDKRYVQGEICRILQQYELAEMHYLQCFTPQKTVEMWIELENLDRAYQIAKTLQDYDISTVYLLQADKKESQKQYQDALKLYKKAQDGRLESLKSVAVRGAIKMMLRCNQIQSAVEQALSLNDPAFSGECGEILQSLAYNEEALHMYVKAQDFNRATALMLKLGKYQLARKIIAKVKDGKVQSDYGKHLEAQGEFSEARQYYIKAQDHLALVQLLVRKLGSVDEAVDLVKQSKDQTAGKYLITYLIEELNDSQSAIDVALEIGQHDLAFVMAKNHNKLDIYADRLVNLESVDNIKSMAEEMEQRQLYNVAAKLHLRLKDFGRVERLLPRLAIDDSYLVICADLFSNTKNKEAAIKVWNSLQKHLSNLDYNLVYQFLSVSGLHDVMTSFVISKSADLMKDEQILDARRILCKFLEDHPEIQNQEVSRYLILCQSFVLSPMHSDRSEIETQAVLLSRLCQSVELFGKAKSKLLALASVKCYNYGAKKQAFKYASHLMEIIEDISEVEDKYQKTIERILRRPEGDERQLPPARCLQCNASNPQDSLNCSQCKVQATICFASGLWCDAESIANCPHCKCTFNRPAIANYLQSSNRCPLCERSLSMDQLVSYDRPYSK